MYQRKGATTNEKLLALSLILVIVLTLSACSNRERGFDLTQTFRWAIIELGNGKLIEGEVTRWRDFEDGDEVQVTINGITYLTHYSKVILATEKP